MFQLGYGNQTIKNQYSAEEKNALKARNKGELIFQRQWTLTVQREKEQLIKCRKLNKACQLAKLACVPQNHRCSNCSFNYM